MKSTVWGKYILYFVVIILVSTQENYGHAEEKNSPAYTQQFKENIQAAVKNHPRTAAAIAQRDSYRFRQREAEAGLYPTLDVGLSGRYRLAEDFEERIDNFNERPRRKESAHATLTGRQLLYDGGQTSSRIASAKHSFTAAHQEYDLTASDVALLAVEMHFQVIFQRNRQILHEEIISDHRDMLDKVILRFESGRGAQRDVALLQSRLALAEAEASSVRKNLESSLSQYEENYGFAAQTLKRPELALNIPATLSEALEVGFQNSPSLSMAGAMTQASKSTVAAEKADQLPHVSLELAATKYDLDRGNDDYDVTGRLVMNYNLYSGGATTARIARSRKDFERTRHLEAETNRRVTREIKVAYQNMLSQDDRVLALKRATDASLKNAEQLLEQFEATGGSLLSLLEAKKDYYQAREQYMAALVEKDILRYSLLDAMGTLNTTLNIRIQKAEE
ncbi:TolC family protein [Paremcibacter congregatus]|uniref:TolC family protein n=1 Tax=Paremcibacter congregatus TaxID=2043170 RepID=UPI0030EC6B18